MNEVRSPKLESNPNDEIQNTLSIFFALFVALRLCAYSLGSCAKTQSNKERKGNHKAVPFLPFRFRIWFGFRVSDFGFSTADGIGVPMNHLRHYLAELSAGRLVLWCYFIWYLFILARYFDADHHIWLTSIGLSLIIGTALLVNTTLSGRMRLRLEAWPAFRLFVMPFCVSSFAALVKNRNFILIFSPRPMEDLIGLGLVVAFCAIVAIAKATKRSVC